MIPPLSTRRLSGSPFLLAIADTEICVPPVSLEALAHGHIAASGSWLAACGLVAADGVGGYDDVIHEELLCKAGEALPAEDQLIEAIRNPA